MGIFERYLSVWVALAMLAGLAGGTLLPGLFATMGGWEYCRVDLADDLPNDDADRLYGSQKHPPPSQRVDCYPDGKLVD